MQQTNAVCFSPNGRRRWWWRRKRGKETFNGPGANITTSYFAKKKLRGKKSLFLCAAAFFKCSGQHKEQFVVYQNDECATGKPSERWGGTTARKSLLIQFCRRPFSFPACFFSIFRYTKYIYPYECHMKNLSSPSELQAAIDGNRREGRRTGEDQMNKRNTERRLTNASV